MHNDDRIHRNKLGQDPAHLAETNEPRYGYVRPHSHFCAPSPAARKLMVECVEFAHLWRNNYDLSADHRWSRTKAHHKLQQINNHLRDLNIKLLREYLPSLRCEKKMRAYRTIANLEAVQAQA